MTLPPPYFYVWFKHTETYEGQPKITIRTQLLEPQPDDTWKPIGVRQYGWHGTEWFRGGGFRRTRGQYGLKFQIMEPEGLEGHVALFKIAIPSLNYETRETAVTMGAEWTLTYLFTLNDRAPWVTLGWTVPEGEPPSYVPPPIEEPVGVAEPPWPFNWMKDFFEGIFGVGSWVGDILTGLDGSIRGLSSLVSGIGGTLVSAVIDNAKDLAASIVNFGSDAMANGLISVLEGTPESVIEVEERLDIRGGEIAAILQELAIPQTYLKPKISPSDTWVKFQDFYKRGFATGHSGQTLRMATEIITAGQCEFATDWIQWLKETFPAWDTMKLVLRLQDEKAWVKPIERYFNEVWTPELPGYSDLINMVVKEKITLDEFKGYMRQQGYSNEFSQLIWDAHFLAPSYGEVARAIWRGTIKPDEVDGFLKRVDLDPYYNEKVWKPLLEEIPPYSELVNERVKEVLTADQFLKYIQYYGFDPVWASRIWDAHFTPASFIDFLTAMRRKEAVLIPVAGAEPIMHTFGEDAAKDIEVIKDLSILADYDPRYWSFFKTRMYNDPTPRMARWAFEVGALTEEDVAEVVHRFGYRPEDEAWFTDMLVGFQERGWVTKYLTACATAYINGVIDADELKKRVVEIANRNEAVADWIIRIADVRKEIAVSPMAAKPKLLGLTDLKKAFLRDKIDEDTLRRELLLRGYDTGDVDILIQLLTDEKTVEEAGGRMVALTIAQLTNAWRHDVVTEDYLRTQLLLRGLSEIEVEQLIETKKRQWGVGTQT